MSKWNTADKTDIRRAVIVQEYGPIDAVEYLRQRSRADDDREVT